MKYLAILLLVVVCGFFLIPPASFAAEEDDKVCVEVAFLADVHLLDLYGGLSDSDYQGVENPETCRMTLARSMAAQLRSTRLFNENYFAFLAALDDVVERKIRYVVMPGDFSDDGQPLNVRGLKRILQDYRNNHGIEFILTTGNHDPVRPFTIEGGKRDFLGAGGRLQAIGSSEELFGGLGVGALPMVETDDLQKLGYRDIMVELGEFGFFPKKAHLYWETPFSNYDSASYSFEKALARSSLSYRQYEVVPGTWVPDVSYLLEPEEGVWFLAIDANVYIPNRAASAGVGDGNRFGSSSIGYNDTLDYKPHLFKWVTSVMERAERLDKRVIVFSHYPMLEFNDGASENIRRLFGSRGLQLHRVPSDEVARRFARAGVRLHFGGHMHINDTSRLDVAGEGAMVNVQVPSLAAYIPAYKIARFGGDRVVVRTVVIDEVPRFKELFALYKMEHDYLSKHSPEDAWDRRILESETYCEFTQWHLRELVRLRFLKKEWPEELREFLMNSTGRDLLNKAGVSLSSVDREAFNWSGFEMICDFYRLRNADSLALQDINRKRLSEYRMVIDALIEGEKVGALYELRDSLREFALIFRQFMEGAPAGDFEIDLKENSLRSSQ